MFNGNPLLRFDGYYILMDLIEIPNLRQKSTEVLKRFMVQLCLGIEQPENPFLPQGEPVLLRPLYGRRGRLPLDCRVFHLVVS